MDRGAGWATVHGVAKESDTTERLTHNTSVMRHLTVSQAQSSAYCLLSPISAP